MILTVLIEVERYGILRRVARLEFTCRRCLREWSVLSCVVLCCMCVCYVWKEKKRDESDIA